MYRAPTEHGDSNSGLLDKHLYNLKQRGCTILVTGTPSSPSSTDVCHRLLGDNDAHPPRHRLFVHTSPARTPPPSTAQNGTTRIINQHRETRHTTTQDVTLPDHIETTTLDSQNLPTLGIKISNAIQEVETNCDGLAPAQLRVCFDSLEALLSDHDTQAVFQFLHILNNRIRAVSGMAHYHLSLPCDDTTVRTFAPLFDILIEQRPGNECTQYRWTIVDEAVTTDWMAL